MEIRRIQCTGADGMRDCRGAHLAAVAWEERDVAGKATRWCALHLARLDIVKRARSDVTRRTGEM